MQPDRQLDCVILVPSSEQILIATTCSRNVAPLTGAPTSRHRVPELPWVGWVTLGHITSPRRHANFNVHGSKRDDTRRNVMRNGLLATVAVTALIGCTSFAVAQTAGREGGAMQSQGAQQPQMANPGATGSPGGGAMSGPSGGSAQNQSTPSTSAPQSSGEPGKGLSQEEHNKSSTPQRGAQGNSQEQRGAPGPGSAQEQRGAQ